MGPNLSEWALKHRSFVVFCMIAASLAGASAFYQLGRDEDPPFTVRTMVVAAKWPGATMDEMLLQVTERLERTLQETPHLDSLRSFTRPGVTTIFVNLVGATTAAQVDDTWYFVRKSVADMRQTLPPGVIGPFFDDEFGDVYGIIYGLTADGFSHRELRDYAERIRSQLLQVPDVLKVEMLGAQDEVIFIEFNTRQLAGLGVDTAAFVAALQAQNVVLQSGTIQTGDEKLALRVTGGFDSEEDIRNVNFVVNGRMIRLRDIATVHRRFADPPQPIFRVNGKNSIGLAIAMRDGGDILTLGRNLDAAMRRITADLPVGIEPTLVANQPIVVEHAISEFLESLWQAIAIIMAVSFISLGVRPGTVVALSIPLTIAITFPIMAMVHIDLQRISLGALIIALTLLVDDAMTTIDAMTERLDAGDEKEEAATFAYRTLAAPMLTGSFITAAGFVPIGFARSSAGEYTFSIFVVVGLALMLSWLVAVIFAPLLGVWILKKPTERVAKTPGRLMRGFRALLVAAMRMRWLTIGLTVASFVAAILASPLVPRQFFPSSDRPELLVDLTLPMNSSIYASEEASSRLDAFLKDSPEVERWSTNVGRGAIRFYLPLDVQLPNDFFTQAVVIAKDVEARKRLQPKLEQFLAEQFPSAVSNVSPLELGPPVGWPVQYRVSGPDLARVQDVALRVAQTIAADGAVNRVNFDWMEPGRLVRINIDQDLARLVGLDSRAIGTALNGVVTGAPITQVRDDIYLVDVIGRAIGEQRVSLAKLQTLEIPLRNGRSVPLNQVATFSYEQEQPLVWRRDRVPTLTVRGAVVGNRSPEGVVAALEPAIAELNRSLPPGYKIVVGGTVEESAKSQASVMAVVPVMLFLMVTFLMIQLQSFSRLALVLAVVPMGIIGVVFTLLLFNRPLGFVAILGILALFGMVARNAVILIEQVEIERAQGTPAWDAVIAACMSRFRPIMLTAISTVLGMIPIAWTVFWGPMAFAIMGGLLVATVLTLIFLPALYVAFLGIKEPRPPAAAPAYPAVA
jgi:multidrug efflux pump subunit AcrB